MRALIIEDMPDMLMVMTEMLSDVGFEVITAENNRIGFELFEKTDGIDVVLVDWKTPEMTGIDFIKSVRAKSHYKDICLVMVTGLNEMEDIQAALDAGANEYLMKPFTKQMLLDKLKLCGMSVRICRD